MRSDYSIHEAKYQEARSRGDVAWGGALAQQRLTNWTQTIDFLMTHENFPRQGSLLELGCGAGNLALMMASRGYQVSGVDISPTAIEWAKQNALAQANSARFLVQNVTELSAFKPEEFDVILDGNCLHCILGEDRPRMLQQAFQVLKSGGVFFICTNCGPVTDDGIEYDASTKCILEKGQPYRYMGEPESVLGELATAGFQVIWTHLNPNSSWTHLKAIAVKPGSKLARHHSALPTQ